MGIVGWEGRWEVGGSFYLFVSIRLVFVVRR